MSKLETVDEAVAKLVEFAENPFRTGFNYANRLCLRNHGKKPRAQPLGCRPTGNVIPSLLSWE
ncbi:MAG: hypothetical protein ABSH01_01515 [Terriglobia bacterium]